MLNYAVLVIGAGFAGSVAARQFAESGKRVLILERRPHIGGNAFDYLDNAGVLIHEYGPHIFHTNNKSVFDYLSRFTQWRSYEHRVAANVHGVRLPVPFNLRSLELAFGDKAPALQKKLLHIYGAEQKVTILELRQSPDADIAALADYVYENIFVHYTLKQWGQAPEEIDPGTTARVPVFLSFDDRYFQDAYQGMPKDGYTALFRNLLDHPNINIRLGVDALEVITLTQDQILLEGAPFVGTILYTGAIDELFGYRFGRLPYRTLDFHFETHHAEWYQSHGTVNYTVDQPYTRITEFKHLTGQVLKDRTTIVQEFSRDYTGTPEESPYYAVISAQSNALYQRYAALAAQYPKLHFLGRLAEYKYYNMDAVVAQALGRYEEVSQ